MLSIWKGNANAQAKKRKRAEEEIPASPVPTTKKQKEDAAHGRSCSV